ncbi:MAG TPA: hypothetical protein VG099_04530 [Gemmataceae bacterium]|nr:hypothetical protein [Gemmataceae bacterium]
MPRLRAPQQGLPQEPVLEKARLAPRRAQAEPLPQVSVPPAQQAPAPLEQRQQPAQPPASSVQLWPQHPSRPYPP